ncbi:MAG: SGNH/GDSL hydrolase family protein [Verrucomicrobiaceae bacterium]|nr:SGNH/GDSL hydrolase family protein [Verrucomicrobiaceae bacterium]
MKITAILVLATMTTVTFAQAAKTPAAKARKPHPSLAKVEDVPGLPRVLLIGDSISMGYTLDVRAMLKGRANVHRIPSNGGPTTNGLKNIQAWLGGAKWDVIHFNWGLHDLKYIQEDPSKRADPKAAGSHQQVALADYEKNLAELVKTMQATGAKLIWCNTTHVPAGSDGRVEGDEVKYNEAAARVMTAAGIPTNDLRAHALAKPEAQLPSNVHYSPEGYHHLAEKVSAVIAEHLPKK